MNIPKLYNDNLIEGIGAGLGLLPVKILREVTETPEQIEAKLALIRANPGPVFYVSTNNPPQFYNRAVMRTTNSWASHAGCIVPKTWAEKIRKQYHDLLTGRYIQGVFGDKIKTLPPVPKIVLGDEVVESQAVVSINNLQSVIKHGEFVVCFLRQWTEAQALAILYALYYLYGAPYDVFEIGSYVSWLFPNFRQIKVCSTLVETALQGKDPNVWTNAPDQGDLEIYSWLKAHGIDPNKTSPADLGRYLFQAKEYTPIAFGCDLEQAGELI